MTGTDTTAGYYRLLGVSQDATFQEIRAAYRARLRLWHPDLVADKTEKTRRTATETTAKLNEAYQCLGNPDLRAAYDTRTFAGTARDKPTATHRLWISPKTLRCEVAPGDTIRLTIDVRTDNPPAGDGLRVRTSDQLEAATFTTTALTATSARVTLRAKTSKLGVHHVYHIPIVVTWGDQTGIATLVVSTAAVREPGPTSPHRRQPTFFRQQRTRPRNRRVRDLTAISIGGIVLPLLLLAWASGLSPGQTPTSPALVASVCIGVIAASTWHLTASRLLRQPERLPRIGVAWGHLMRWTGWILVAGCASLVGIPAMVIVLLAIIATPLLGFIVIALISGRFDSPSK